MRSSLEPVAGLDRAAADAEIGDGTFRDPAVGRTEFQGFRTSSPAHPARYCANLSLGRGVGLRVRRSGPMDPRSIRIVAGGARTASAHAHPTGAELRRGHLVLVDMAPCLPATRADMTRMLFLGKPDARVKHATARCSKRSWRRLTPSERA